MDKICSSMEFHYNEDGTPFGHQKDQTTAISFYEQTMPVFEGPSAPLIPFCDINNFNEQPNSLIFQNKTFNMPHAHGYEAVGGLVSMLNDRDTLDLSPSIHFGGAYNNEDFRMPYSNGKRGDYYLENNETTVQKRQDLGRPLSSEYTTLSGVSKTFFEIQKNENNILPSPNLSWENQTATSFYDLDQSNAFSGQTDFCLPFDKLSDGHTAQSFISAKNQLIQSPSSYKLRSREDPPLVSLIEMVSCYPKACQPLSSSVDYSTDISNSCRSSIRKPNRTNAKKRKKANQSKIEGGKERGNIRQSEVDQSIFLNPTEITNEESYSGQSSERNQFLLKNSFEVAKIYHEKLLSVISFCSVNNETFHSIFGGQYDHNRVLFDNSPPPSASQKPSFSQIISEIDIKENQLISFDANLTGNPFRRYRRNPKTKDFKFALREKITDELKGDLFLDFVHLSLDWESKAEKLTYLAWKKKVFDRLSEISKTIKEKIFSKRPGEKINNFISLYLTFCVNSLIREIMRHALFSIPMDEKNYFFISRAGIASFFNHYSDHFLKKIAEYQRFCNHFSPVSRGRKSYLYWRETKSSEIKEIVRKNSPDLIKNINLDFEKIHQQVLVLDAGGFRTIKENEFESLKSFIWSAMKKEDCNIFAERAVHHFYWKTRRSVRKKF